MRRSKSIGPFKDADDKAQSFGLGMYYSHCLNATIKELVALEEEYQLALETANESLMAEKKKELSFYENVILLATDAYTTIAAETYDSGSAYD